MGGEAGMRGRVRGVEGREWEPGDSYVNWERIVFKNSFKKLWKINCGTWKIQCYRRLRLGVYSCIWSKITMWVLFYQLLLIKKKKNTWTDNKPAIAIRPVKLFTSLPLLVPVLESILKTSLENIVDTVDFQIKIRQRLQRKAQAGIAGQDGSVLQSQASSQRRRLKLFLKTKWPSQYSTQYVPLVPIPVSHHKSIGWHLTALSGTVRVKQLAWFWMCRALCLKLVPMQPGGAELNRLQGAACDLTWELHFQRFHLQSS